MIKPSFLFTFCALLGICFFANASSKTPVLLANQIPLTSLTKAHQQKLLQGLIKSAEKKQLNNFGRVGPVGPTGPRGPRGLRGPAGARGLQGVAGARGLVGPVGLQGLMGPTGPAGLVGPVGPTGPSIEVLGGVIGPVGATGPVGPTGPIGNIGPQGIQGLQGPLGPTGATGPAGEAGATGATGASVSPFVEDTSQIIQFNFGLNITAGIGNTIRPFVMLPDGSVILGAEETILVLGGLSLPAISITSPLFGQYQVGIISRADVLGLTADLYVNVLQSRDGTLVNLSALPVNLTLLGSKVQTNATYVYFVPLS